MANAKHSPNGRLGSLKKYPVLILFFVCLYGLFLFDLVTPDKKTSALENTSLTQRPTLSLAGKDFGGAVNAVNDYFTTYTRYVKDQVAGRDLWVSAQAGMETLLFQKQENGGMLLGKDGMMFTRAYGLLASEQKRLPMNTNAVCKLASRYPGKVTLLVAPSAALVYPEKVPTAAPLLDEATAVEDIMAQAAAAGAKAVDVRPALAAHSEEYLYYRTDHHWTTAGAYYAYDAFCESIGLPTRFDRAAHTAVTVPDFYGTSFSKARTPTAQADSITYYDIPNQMAVYRVQKDGTMAAPETTTGLYNMAQWQEYDKYAAFLYGNNGYSRIEGNGTGSILVVKDSYANSFVPYLTENYATVDVVDFRGYASGLDSLIAGNDYDTILVLYSFASFKADLYLNRAGLEG